MADYMNMIKNPKPRSPRAQASPRSTRQYESPSSPKGNSDSYINLVSLNRPMSRIIPPSATNLYNPQPLSRRSSQVGSPLNRSSDNIMRRSTPSFIGETTSQIVHRTPPAVDNSLNRSMSGSIRGFREDYDGLNRVSQISRRSQVSPTERSPTFRAPNGSMRESMRRSSIKLERKKVNKRKIDLPVIILGIVIVTIGFLILRSIFPSSIVFCDTGKTSTPPGCGALCPPHGICEGGELIGCDKGFTVHKHQCVQNFEVKMRFEQYRKFINDKLTAKKGERLCDNSVIDSMTLHQVLDALRSKFGDDKYLWWDEESFKDHFISKEAGDVYSDDGGETFKTHAVANPSFSCKMRLLWIEGKVFGLWLALFIATVAVLIKFGMTRAVYTNLAAEVYAEVLDYLSYWQKCTVKTLRREFEDKYPDKDFEKLWHYVEELVIKGGRINKFFDYYQNEVQEFWVLLY